MISAFLIGLFGSVHCVGMCGPLMLTLTKDSGKQSVTSFLLYHMGRIGVYALVGVFFGFIASSIQLLALQRYAAIGLGLLIILLFGFPKIRNTFEGWYYRSRLYQQVKRRMIGFYSSRFRWLAAGTLNGALPCGLIYLAAAGSMLATSWWNSISYMILFGMGTLPLLVSVSWLRSRFPATLRRFPNLTTIIAMVSGFVLIARGLIIENPDLNELITAQVMKVMTVCGL